MKHLCEYCDKRYMVWCDFKRHLQTKKHRKNHMKFTDEDIQQLESNRNAIKLLNKINSFDI